MENCVFNAEEDLDHIEVLTSENLSTHSEHLSSVGSRNFLTAADANHHRARECTSSSPHECIELSTTENILRRKSSILDGENLNNARVPTPINMVRRWSQSISRFSKSKRSLRGRTISRMPSRRLFEVDGNAIITDPNAELQQLVQEIEQHDYLMQTNPLSKQSRLETLRSLPQPLSVKRLLKAQLSLSMEQQHSNDPQNLTRKIAKCLLNVVVLLFLKLWKFFVIICNGVEFWYDSLKTIEGHFGSNVSSYFKFLRWLFALNLVLFIFPLGLITIPQILYNDHVRWRSSNKNMSIEMDAVQYDSNTTTDVNISGNQTWSVMDFLTGQGILKSSLMFYSSYSNVTFSYRNSQNTYSIPNAYYMTMLMLYLSTFVVISISVARSYRKSYIETSNGIRSIYASKICFAWDYSIADRKAANLKHFAICAELKQVLIELNGAKTKLSIWNRIWIYCTQTIAHLLVCTITAGAGMAIWLLLKECGDTNIDDTSWSTLYVATVVNLTILLLQTVFYWISSLEDYRSPRRTLHIALVRNFLLESTIIGVLLFYWVTKTHAEGWETAIGQEMYRFIILDCFISLLLLPIISCLRVFLLIRYFPKCERPEFNISLKSLGLVFNQSLLWIGLFFAPLLAGIMVIKMILLFYVNKAMLMHICKSPRHVWRSPQTSTLYLLFSFLSLLGVIITLGYIMTQIPISQQNGPFRDESYMFQIFIDGVLRLRQNHTIWSILMFLIRPAVVGGMLIVMSVMVYYLHEKSRAHCRMVKLLKEMIYEETKDKEFLLASLTKITKNRDWYVNSTIGETATDLADQLTAESSPMWQFVRKRGGSSQPSCSVSVASAASVVTSVDECGLHNRNV